MALLMWLHVSDDECEGWTGWSYHKATSTDSILDDFDCADEKSSHSTDDRPLTALKVHLSLQ